MIYHEGFLMADRLLDPDLDRRARQLLKAAEAGEVQLTQRKITEGVYQYLANPRRSKSWWPGA